MLVHLSAPLRLLFIILLLPIYNRVLLNRLFKDIMGLKCLFYYVFTTGINLAKIHTQ